MQIKDLVEVAHMAAKEKGFHDEARSFGDEVALIHTEVSEAMEAFRERGLSEWSRADGKPEGVASELADAVIRIADACGAHGIDLERAIKAKLLFNRTRPYKHGKRL